MKSSMRATRFAPFISEPWRRTYTSLAVSQPSNAGPKPVAAAVTDRVRRRSKRKSPPGLFRRARIVLLSTRDRSARIIENGSYKPALKPVARGDILNPIPSRPVGVMATAIVRVHWHFRDGRFRVGANNSRSMMLNVSAILTISLGERRRTEQSGSRHRH
jgi:hypothetical protein